MHHLQGGHNNENNVTYGDAPFFNSDREIYTRPQNPHMITFFPILILDGIINHLSHIPSMADDTYSSLVSILNLYGLNSFSGIDFLWYL